MKLDDPIICCMCGIEIYNKKDSHAALVGIPWRVTFALHESLAEEPNRCCNVCYEDVVRQRLKEIRNAYMR